MADLKSRRSRGVFLSSSDDRQPGSSVSSDQHDFDDEDEEESDPDFEFDDNDEVKTVKLGTLLMESYVSPPKKLDVTSLTNAVGSWHR